MKLPDFELERWLPSLSAEVNIAGAIGVPLKYRDLIDGLDLDKEITYGSTRGSLKLREQVAALGKVKQIHPDEVLITNGTAEANFLLMSCLLEAGDELVLVMPTYLQWAGLARSFGAEVKRVFLHEDEGWKLHIDELEAATSPRTKVILITNPNNPTSSWLDRETIEAVCRVAGRIGAYVVADEALKGLESHEVIAPSPFELYERGFSTSSLSKLGAPGLRIGWILGARDVIDRCWAHKDYTTLAHGGFSESLAQVILEPANFDRLRGRAAAYVREHSAILKEWVRKNDRVLSWAAPEPLAGGSAFPTLKLEMDSLTFCRRAAQEVSVALSPGEFFGAPGHFRLRYSTHKPVLEEGLARLDRLFAQLESTARV